MVWRVVLSNIATLSEIDQHWTIMDLLDANEALDWKIECEEAHRKASEMKMKR